ncbi:FecR family protein [Acidovorax lacteus]|uniref:FecR protein domain-containing protein n=1 Tax=Acidovorax lacteus TaxID=1924988 RepID=A0ABP8L3Q8_9BURK
MPALTPSFRLAWWAALVAAWPLQSLAAAGLVQFSTGDVQLRRAGSTSAVSKGLPVEAGDVLLTGADGRAQIRFSDGGLVALYPGSQFTVTRYADTGNPAQDQFAVSLLQGGLRAITGLIGKREPRNYQVTTPTAVVGIRGSAFLVAFNAVGEVVVSGEEDEIEVCTRAGCVGVKAGESVRVVSDAELPLYTHTRALLPLPPAPLPYVMGEQLGGGGRVQPLPAPVPEPPAPATPAAPAPQPVPTPVPAPDPGQPGAPPPVTVPGPQQPPTTRPPAPTTPTTPTTPPAPTTPTAPAPPATRPPITTLPPIVRPIFVLPPIAVPPPPPVIR